MAVADETATMPPAKRPRSDEDATGAAAEDMPSFEDWMMSWRRGTESDDGQRVLEPAASKEEVLAKIALEEQRRRRELDDAISALDSELMPLVLAAEAAAGVVCARLAELQAPKANDEEVLRLAVPFAGSAGSAQSAVQACGKFSTSEKCILLRSGSDVPASARQHAGDLLRRCAEVERDLEEMVAAAERTKQAAVSRIEKAALQKKVLIDVEITERLFERYDKDEDGRLNAKEVRCFALDECNYDLPNDKLEEILGSQPFASAGGTVSKEAFPRLRLLVGAASVAGALQGVEAELVKAEKLARPLSARGPAAVPLRELPSAVEELDLAIDVAKDFLGAARDQVDGLAGNDESLRIVAPEAASLGSRLERLEARFAEAQGVAKYCHDRLELQRRKAALLRDIG